ncbi:hypothetical protein BCR39DRAFT_361401 [Naematelia encephala]|uniref:N-acetyltransferase domain-containing protein n=1 Tax=Naematelia encephala TaxID=71784 RepID=A0A1Y2AM14_9TREE|nr:hypothetical protein BCR39DRAFT_361401 [Naematelia encephala]
MTNNDINHHIQWDSTTDEPFLPVPGFPTLRLTPYREGEQADMVELCNHPLVGRYSYLRPYPYDLSHAQWMYDNIINKNLVPAVSTLRSLRESPLQPNTLPPLVTYPLSVLRYSPSYAISTTSNSNSQSTSTPTINSQSTSISAPQSTSTSTSNPQSDSTSIAPSSKSDLSSLGLKDGAFMGTINIFPAERDPSSDKSIPIPRQDQVWMVAYDIFPILQGRGIGSAVLKVFLEEWCEWMNIRIRAEAQRDNIPSSRILAKAGFVHSKDIVKTWPEEKGGGDRLVGVWDWAPTRQ